MPDPVPDTGVRAPVGVDTTRASIARVYDYSLGGKDNYEVDRYVFDKLCEVAPHQAEVSHMNRRWLHRVVRYLTTMAGVDQFLDLGAGLPTALNTHTVAQRENPDARVVYVDNDPVCHIHGRVLLETNPNTRFVLADLTQPESLLRHADIISHLDLARPVALILCGILHHVDDALDPPAITRQYIDALAPGSYLAITYFWDPDDGSAAHDLARELQRRFTETGLGSGWYRTRREILDYFGDLEIMAPGLVELDDWWPAGPAFRPRLLEEQLMLGGLAHKPRSARVVQMVTR
ncbi:SAM-dependent methyltransferase [Nocardia abscessus]|uniref:SAM-dependent methyltransferase n=1 Tax=Nocardia abscessus TaxID=120957 RepID=UPI0003065AB8|nr:SAM-dependent methyltransferase [Nocardia abscessus]MCC3328289.1 SAM-dependent methyltransferase [Nocardia abscessus]